PVLGKSYAEIAGISRSMHRSQGMGAPERRGSLRESFKVVAGESAHKDIFDGVDLSWKRAGSTQIGDAITKAIATFDPLNPDRTIPELLRARPALQRFGDKDKIRQLDEAIALCGGLWLDASADRYDVIPGESVKVKLT